MTQEEHKAALGSWQVARGCFCSYGADRHWVSEVQKFYAKVTVEIDFNIMRHENEIRRLECEANATHDGATA